MQVYVATDAGPVRRPARELRAFAKVALEPGESRTVEFDLDRRAFAYWDIELSQWVVSAGSYAVQIGENASEIVAAESVVLRGDVLLRPLTLDSTVGDWFAHPSVGPALMQGLAAAMTLEQSAQAEESGDALRMVESMPMQQFLAFTGGALPMEWLEQLMASSAGDEVAA